MMSNKPGRSCPLHYRYSPTVFAAQPTILADTLYVVGGLYGNPFALQTVVAMAEREKASVVFNGDFNWFDIDARSFTNINETVLRYMALRGNVETEFATDDTGAGCGCAYPDWVGDAEVERSNQILDVLRKTASAHPALRSRVGQLPPYLVARVGDVKIGIVHGDAESLSGWGFSQELLRDDPRTVKRMLVGATVDVFASSHTCLPVLQEIFIPRGSVLIANNGAAGMPNFEGTHFGLATRISTTPSTSSLYGRRAHKVYVDAIPIEYDQEAWVRYFDRLWPEGSAASLSYRKRIVSGPVYQLAQAIRFALPQAQFN